MNNIRLIRTVAVASMLAFVSLSVGACTSTETSESSGEYLDDSVVSTKVRSAIVGDKNLSIFKIDVETYKGIVQLSGFVDTERARSHASTVAAGVTGVKQVRNDLIVK
ncbi:BON domain-containing protein [Magnetospira thiophila]